jgi:hypothetical protein
MTKKTNFKSKRVTPSVSFYTNESKFVKNYSRVYCSANAWIGSPSWKRRIKLFIAKILKFTKI